MNQNLQSSENQWENGLDSQRILGVVQIGLWRVEMKEGKECRFYADAVTDALLGVEKSMTPEERYIFHRARIHPEDAEMFSDFSDTLSQARSEVVYRYLHPVRGELFIRCAGVRDMEITDYKLYHMNAEALRIYDMESIEQAQRELHGWYRRYIIRIRQHLEN